MIYTFKTWKTNKTRYFDTNNVILSKYPIKPLVLTPLEAQNSARAEQYHCKVGRIRLCLSKHCNHRCKYCYIKHPNTTPFTAENAIKVIKTIHEKFGDDMAPKDRIVIQPDMLGEIGIYSDEYIKLYEWLLKDGYDPYNIWYNTNGTMSLKVLEYFKSLKRLDGTPIERNGFSVSLDGPKEIHDRQRIKKGGKSSFDGVMNFIDGAKKLGYTDVYTFAVVMEEDYSPSLVDLFTWFVDNDYIFDFVPAKIDGYWTIERMNKFEKHLNELYEQIMVDTFENHDYKWLTHSQSVFFHYIENLFFHTKSVPSVCRTWGCLAVEENGDLWSCEYVGETAQKRSKFNIYTLDVNEYKKAFNGEQFIQCAPEHDPLCNGCPYQGLCGKNEVCDAAGPDAAMIYCKFHKISADWALKFVAALMDQPIEIKKQIVDTFFNKASYRAWHQSEKLDIDSFVEYLE